MGQKDLCPGLQPARDPELCVFSPFARPCYSGCIGNPSVVVPLRDQALALREQEQIDELSRHW